MEMMLITQYFDTLRDIGASGKAATVFVPHGCALPLYQLPAQSGS